MKLLELRLHGFGRLVNQVRQPGPGLNVIIGPNEAGKSTLQRFIQGMLYGLQQPGALRRAPLPELAQLEPWNTGEYRGELCYALADGREFWVARDFRDPSKTTVQDAATGEPLRAPQDRRKELLFAQQHLGLTETEFLGSACMGALAAAPTSAPGLAARVAAVLQSGAEQLGPERALATLDKQRTQVRQAMQPVQQRLSDLQSRAARQQAAAADLATQRTARQHVLAGAKALETQLAALPPDLSNALHRLLAKHDALLADLHAARTALQAAQAGPAQVAATDPWPADADLQAEALWQRISAAQPALQRTQAASAQHESTVNRLRAALDALPADPTTLRAQWEALAAAEPAQGVSARYGILALVLAAAASVAAFWLHQPLLYIASGILGASGAAMLTWTIAAARQQARHERRTMSFLQRVGAASPAALQIRLEEAEQARNQVHNAQADLEGQRREAEALQSELLRLTERLRSLLALTGILLAGPVTASHVEAFTAQVGLHRAAREAAQAQFRSTAAAAEQATQRVQALQAEAAGVAGDIQHLCDTAGAALGDDVLDPESVLEHATRLQEQLATQQREAARLHGAVTALEESLGDPVLTELDLAAAQSDLTQLQARHATLAVAKDLIQSAATEMARQMAPRLVQAVSDWAAHLTDGAYSRLTIDAELGVRVHSAAAGRLVDLDTLSTGARDQLWLALRLGLVDALTQEYGEAPPLLLDDPFAHADDARAAAGFRALALAAERYQLFVFTCRERDQAAAEVAAAQAEIPCVIWRLPS